jgi:hypothetical protein
MNHDRLRRSALVIATVTIGLLASMSGTFGDAVSNLNDAWRTAYEHAAKQTLSNLRASVPVLVNRFDQIALYRPGMDRPDLFSMDPTIYREAKSVAHTPAALYVRLAASGLGTLDEARLQWLAAYQSLLSDAEAEIGGRADIPAQIRAMQTGMLADVHASRNGFSNAGQSIKPSSTRWARSCATLFARISSSPQRRNSSNFVTR